MSGYFTFADFPEGEAMGSVEMVLSEAFRDRWRRVYPGDEAAEGALPPAVSTVVLMHAWRTIVDPKPPGNVHAGQQVTVAATPRLGERIATAVRCLSKEERKGRKFVRLQTVSTGEDGRALFTGETTLIWAL